MSSKQLPLKTVKQEQKWTLFSSSQSLSAALNDPACREYDFFTKTWGSYFIPNAPLPLPPTDLPKIELVDFQRYIKETAAVRDCCLLKQQCFTQQGTREVYCSCSHVVGSQGSSCFAETVEVGRPPSSRESEKREPPCR